MQTKLVAAPCGDIMGAVTDYGAVFRGVKYAEAPRFGMPVPVSYAGVQDATRQGPCCPQMRAFWNEEHRFYYREFRKGKTFTYSEDCLILDIHQPKDAKDAPVIVFIHGGSFTGGSVNEMQFDGSAYARRGIIFVAINYRLNVFGFFADGENSTGNLGIYDQAAAISWLRRNISAFGGDPDNITLMGQSAGAMSVQTLICSDEVKGLVKGAVMLSGGGKRGLLLPLSKPNTRYWKKLMKASGAADIEEFGKLPTEHVWTTWKTKHLVGKALQTKPVLDGKLIKNDRYDTSVPTVIGTVKKDLLPPVLNHMARAFARKQKKKGTPCYVFSFRHPLPPDGASFHSCDLWYALGSLGNSPRPFGKEDYALSAEMVDRIAAFARTGDPNTADHGGWKTYSSSKDIKVFE